MCHSEEVRTFDWKKFQEAAFFYGKEVNDGFAKSTKATLDSCRLTRLPGRINSKLEN